MSAPSETSALLASGNPTEQRLRDELKQMAGPNAKLEKSEFKTLLLRHGILVKQAVLEEIFTQCDTDGDGGLTVDELFRYLRHYDTTSSTTPTWKDALQYTVHKTTGSVVWWFAVAFHFAAWVGLVSFIYSETGKHIRSEWSIVGAWFFFFGAIYFFKLLLDYETTNYDTATKAKLILKKCIDKDPTFFDRKAGDDAAMDRYELNAVLEEQGLYLPLVIFNKLFTEVDNDAGGVITKDNIVHFAKTTKEPTSQERQMAIKDAVVRTWGFWSLIFWFMGSILFLVGAHLSYAGYTEPPLPKHTYLHLYGMGSVMYFLLAVCILPMLYSEVKDYLDSIEQMSKAFVQKRKRNGKDTSDAQLFKSLDSDLGGGPDGGLDATELYEALIEEGVLIPYDTFLECFKTADESGDGKLQVKEFTNFIANMEIARDPWQYRMQMLKRFPLAPSFFGWLMFFVGGIFFVMGSYIDVSASAYWYFGGAICYGLASGRSVFGAIQNYWAHFYAIEAGKAEFKARIAGDGMPDVA